MSPVRWRRHLWPLLIGLLAKGGFFIWNAYEQAGVRHMGRWALWDADLWEYIDTVESYLRGDGWQPDHRMPGYALVFLFFRLFLAQPAASDAITLVQLLVAVVAGYALARGVQHASGRERIFWPLYGLLLVASFHSLVDLVVINESFTTWALVLHWVAYAAWRRTGHVRWIFFSGLCIAIAVFMRPIYGPLLAVVPLLELCRRGALHKRTLGLLALFALPFIVFDGLWTIRNHRAYGGFHPLTNHGSYNPVFSALPYYSLIWFVQGYGGHCYYWDPIADIRWYGFEPDAGGGTARAIPGVPEPPPDVYTSVCDRDSLEHMAGLMRLSREPSTTSARTDSLARVMMASARRWREAYAREKPWHYQVIARLRLLKHETVHSGSNTLFQRPFSALGPVEKGYKLLQSLIYWWVMIAGMAGAVVLASRVRTDPAAFLLGIMCLYGVVACPFIMRMAEIRYLIPVFPLLLAASIWGAAGIVDRIRRR